MLPCGVKNSPIPILDEVNGKKSPEGFRRPMATNGRTSNHKIEVQ